MKNSIVIIASILIILLPYSVLAVNVGGNIMENTVWTSLGSPYNLTSNINIYDGITLTIEPGVELNGNNHKIINAGILSAEGSNNNRIIFGNIEMANANERNDAVLRFNYCKLKEGCYFSCLQQYGDLIITNSILSGHIAIYYLGDSYSSTGEVRIEKNILSNFGMTLMGDDSNLIWIVNNIFEGDSRINLEYVTGYIKYNSFLNNNIDVIILNQYCTSNVDITNNYWNTTNTDVIDSMIYDGNDDLNITGYADYIPFLTNPDKLTPKLSPPEANAGEDQTVNENVQVTLDGSNSTDEDDSIVSYKWEQTNGTPVIINDSSKQTINFISPNVGPDGTNLEFKLTVTNNYGLQDTDTCIVNVTWVNEPPTAAAGEHQIVEGGASVILDGTNSFDPESMPLLYFWEQTEGTAIELSDETSVTPSFTAPNPNDALETLTFQLTVTDSGGLKDTGEVAISVSKKDDSNGDNNNTDKASDRGGGGCFINTFIH